MALFLGINYKEWLSFYNTIHVCKSRSILFINVYLYIFIYKLYIYLGILTIISPRLNIN